MTAVIDFLENLDDYHLISERLFHIPKGFYLPSFWVTALAYLTKPKSAPFDIDIPNEKNYSYARAICFLEHLGIDTNIKRPNNGINYSSIEKLDCDLAADQGKTRIASCLRNTFHLERSDPSVKAALDQLITVIGELHDNVISHSHGEGFSMAQKHPHFDNTSGNFVSFAIADNGIGFLKELQAQGIPNINNDQEAIHWCIQEEHTSKKKYSDDWSQRVPEDSLSNPYGKHVQTRYKDNNHQGLGLFKLLQLTKQYKGELHILSGISTLYIDKAGEEHYSELNRRWDGVIVNLVLNVDEFNKQQPEEPTTEIKDLMDLLRR